MAKLIDANIQKSSFKIDSSKNKALIPKIHEQRVKYSLIITFT